MAQFHNFGILKTVASLISIRSKIQIHVRGSSVDNCLQDSFLLVSEVIFNLLVVTRIFKDHVSDAQNPVYRLEVIEFTVLSTSEFCLREF